MFKDNLIMKYSIGEKRRPSTSSTILAKNKTPLNLSAMSRIMNLWITLHNAFGLWTIPHIRSLRSILIKWVILICSQACSVFLIWERFRRMGYTTTGFNIPMAVRKLRFHRISAAIRNWRPAIFITATTHLISSSVGNFFSWLFSWSVTAGSSTELEGFHHPHLGRRISSWSGRIMPSWSTLICENLVAFDLFLSCFIYTNIRFACKLVVIFDRGERITGGDI